MDQAKYNKILDSILKDPVHPRLRPVHFSEDGATFGWSGTLVLGDFGQHAGIITAAHSFSLGRNRKQLFYQVLQPYSNNFHAIGRVTQVNNRDVAICYPGPATPIEGFSSYQSVSTEEITVTPYAQTYSDCVLLTTGEKIPVLGHIITQSGEEHFVLQYNSYDGESGSGCLRDDDGLYVIRGSIPLDEQLRSLWQVPCSMSRVTLAAGIQLH